MREPVLVAMSGGVDSSVAALLLLEAGHPVVGVFMRGGSAGGPRPRGCCSEADAADVRRVADRLGIPFHTKDLRPGFAALERYFAESYHAGETPNPCLVCNARLKFGALLELADALGCAAVATGHYARLEWDADGEPVLRRARDRRKDQSYALLALRREQLRRARFPLGDLTKEEVRALARDRGLPVAAKPESQEICFVPDDYRAFLRRRNPERLRPGPFLDLEGRQLGTHGGHQLYTIGQRRGLGVALGYPAYVVRKDPVRNAVILGPREALAARSLTVAGFHWLAPEPAGRVHTLAVQIRHRHEAVPARVEATDEGTARVVFARPVFAAAPGQGAAFYDGDRLVAGGWIRAVA